MPSGLAGEVAGTGRVSLADGEWAVREARFTLSKLRLSHGEAALSESAPISIDYAGGKISMAGAKLGGPGTDIEVSVSVDTQRGGALAGTISGNADAGNLETLAGSEASLTGPLRARLALSGTLSRPMATAVELSGGRFKSSSSPYVLEAIAAQLVWSGSRASLESFRARVEGRPLRFRDAELDGMP